MDFLDFFSLSLPANRRPSRVVQIGCVSVGGSHPIRVQSMLTAETPNIPEVMGEIRILSSVGCELIRLTVPNQKAVDALPLIRYQMSQDGIEIPLIADIHFNPQLAVNSCEFVEKVRINPGNYADKKRFEQKEYTDQTYQDELARLEDSLLPLIKQLKTYRRALRIGTNHGSLSDRIVNRYGDSPKGMVESALEFVRIFQKYDFHDMVLSMKASNPVVMIQAYRSLVTQMSEEGMDYPLHLGVTEAGLGMDGRVKSAIGIGGLLYDGIGDTIRVSLTEPPENEIPAAREILLSLEQFKQKNSVSLRQIYQIPLITSRRDTLPITINKTLCGNRQPIAFFGVTQGRVLGVPSEIFDGFLENDLSPLHPQSSLKISKNAELLIVIPDAFNEDDLLKLIQDHPAKPHLLLVQGTHLLNPTRRLVTFLENHHISWPVGVLGPLIKGSVEGTRVAAEIGILLTERLLDIIICPTADSKSETLEWYQTILQATRVRLSRADFISCPSCGRTYFDLQQTTRLIQKRTKHLKGVKIAVMGCVVNGPGEMADADFGYVGSGENKISLYRGQQCVSKNVPASEAVDRLVELIRSEGLWVDPPSQNRECSIN